MGRELSDQSPSVQVFVLGRLARGAETADDIERIAPFFQNVSLELQSLWVESVARVDYERYREIIEEAREASAAVVRRAAQSAELRYLARLGRRDELERRIATFQVELSAAATADPGEAATAVFRETADMLFRVEDEIGEPVVAVEWDGLQEDRRFVLLELLSVRARRRYFDMLCSLLNDSRYRNAAIPAIAALPPEYLLDHLTELRQTDLPVRIELLRAFQDPILLREEGADLLAHLLSESIGVDEAGAEDARRMWFLSNGDAAIEVGLTVLSDPAPISAPLSKHVKDVAETSTALFPEIFQIRFAAEEITSTLQPLVIKYAGEQLDQLALLILILHALNLSREDDRLLAYTVCRELSERAAAVQHTTLEFIEAKVPGDVLTYLMTYYEPVTIDEKRGRLRSLLRRSGDDLTAIVTGWRAALTVVGDTTAAELYKVLALQVGVAVPSPGVHET
ncbi:MAG: hypothetical protein WD492_01315 [Alkalispirochaeta sp.]